MRGIVIAGTHSGCGKTTVTLGILAALKKKGLVAQPFKAGPDFIDAGLHQLLVERPSRNLDQWMCGRDYVIDCFNRHALNADIAVIEGVMGMYDGDFSTAGLASLLQVPVVLVVDGYGMAESAGAVVKGFAEFWTDTDPSPNPLRKGGFAGVIFNRVASESHYTRLKDSVRDVPVMGYLPRDLDFEIPHRHLGLATAEENPITRENIEKLADTVLRYVDVDAMIRKAEPAKGKDCHREDAGDAKETGKFKLAVAWDKAFSFYYQDSLDLLHDAGAEIIRFSPLADPSIPDGVAAVYIGGGYPEIHASALSRNAPMLQSIRAWADAGRPLYAECGGLMYLSMGVHDFDGNFFDMAGVFPFQTRMTKKPRLGYREIVFDEECILGARGETCRGHEFHYSEIVRSAQMMDVAPGYRVKDRNKLDLGTDGFRIKNTLASYIHVHFGSSAHIAERFTAFVQGERIA